MYPKFTPLAWAHHSNCYEVNVRQFTPEGTFNAFAKHLPRLKNMGVDILWFMPITPISVEKRQGTLGSYYACSDYTSINPEFGTMDDFRNLVMESHRLGFKVIIDWVANHTGWDHIWTTTHPEFYKKNAEGQFYDNHNWHDVIDLNYYDQTMRGEMISAMQFWINECDIDGFRCDMAHLVPLDFWRQARIALDAIKPLFWLAETEHSNYLDVFDCCYAWHWMTMTEKFCKNQCKLQDLKDVLSRYEKEYPPHTFHLFFTSNHDENSWNGTEYEKYGDAAKALAVFCSTWNGMPLTYSGQELPNKKRLKFFERDAIEWTFPPLLEDFYKKLFYLRKNHPAVSAGLVGKPAYIPTNVDQYVFAFVRSHDGRDVLVLLNLSPNHLFVQIPDGYVYGKFRNIFTGNIIDIVPQHSFEMHAWDYLVMEK